MIAMPYYSIGRLWDAWGTHMDLEAAKTFIELGCSPQRIVRDALLLERYDLVFFLADHGADLQAIYLPEIQGEEWVRARRILPLIDTPEKRSSLRGIFVSLAEWAIQLPDGAIGGEK